MSNSRRLRAKKPKSKRGTVTPEQHRQMHSIGGALGYLARRGVVDKGDFVTGDYGARGRTYKISESGERYVTRGVLVDAIKDQTPGGLLRLPLPKGWKRHPMPYLTERTLLHIADPSTGATGLGRVVRINERKRLCYLKPEWGAEPMKPRTPSQARAEAREQPEPCARCGRPAGEDCVTATGKRVLWPHAVRDPLLPNPATADSPS